MDGTLWNATDSYARIWNMTCSQFGLNVSVTGAHLTKFMGMSISDIVDGLLGAVLPEKSDSAK